MNLLQICLLIAFICCCFVDSMVVTEKIPGYDETLEGDDAPTNNIIQQKEISATDTGKYGGDTAVEGIVSLGTNVAMNKPIADNTEHYDCGFAGRCNYVANRITDGRAAGETDIYNSFCSRAPYASITVDLEDSYDVRALRFWARPPRYRLQAKDLEFHVSDTLAGLDDPSALFLSRPGIPTVRPEVFTRETPLQGRYVRVQMQKDNTNDFLCFIELEVYGGVTAPPNDAPTADTDCDEVDCGEDGYCDSDGGVNDGEFTCMCGCNKVGRYCEVSPYASIQNISTTFSSGCHSVTVGYIRHLNYNVSGLPSVSGLLSAPNYVLYYKTKKDFTNSVGDWMTTVYQETSDWTASMEIGASVTLSGLMSQSDYVGFVQYSLPGIKDNCNHTTPLEDTQSFEFKTCTVQVRATSSEREEAQAICKGRRSPHQFRVGCTCWICYVQTFARQQDCVWQTEECR